MKIVCVCVRERQNKQASARERERGVVNTVTQHGYDSTHRQHT